MITTEQIIYIILFILVSLVLIFVWIKRKKRYKTKTLNSRKTPHTIEELFEEYEEPPEFESEPEQEQEIKKKPKKPVSLLDQDFEF